MLATHGQNEKRTTYKRTFLVTNLGSYWNLLEIAICLNVATTIIVFASGDDFSWPYRITEETQTEHLRHPFDIFSTYILITLFAKQSWAMNRKNLLKDRYNNNELIK